MTREQFDVLNKLVVAPLKAQGAEVYIFGSRVAGKCHSHSDVDLLYVLPEQINLPSGFISKINESIEESRFPYRVDLVADAQLAESYRESVYATRLKL